MTEQERYDMVTESFLADVHDGARQMLLDTAKKISTAESRDLNSVLQGLCEILRSHPEDFPPPQHVEAISRQQAVANLTEGMGRALDGLERVVDYFGGREIEGVGK